MRNDHDAQDVVQESYLRALRSFDTFQPGRDGRAWLLKIVRNTCYTWLAKNRGAERVTSLDENKQDLLGTDPDPEMELITKANSEMIHDAIGSLSVEFREVLILREIEDLSYKEIAQIVDVPLGTVMSRLSRGRKELQARLSEVLKR